MITFEYYTPSFLPEANEAVARFVSGMIWGRSENAFGQHSSMGVFDGNELIAGTVYHNWYPSTQVMELSSASVSKRWLMPKVIYAMFAFPFDMMGAQMVALRVSEKNKTMVSIAKRFGFEGVLIPRLRGRDESEWIFTLTDDAWRDNPIAKRYRDV